jgi:hypothetical protein
MREMFRGATAMLKKLPHLRLRDPPGTPNVDDWKAEMYPRDQLFLDYKKPRDHVKFIRDLMNRMVKNPSITNLNSGVIDELEEHDQIRPRQHLFQ